MSFILIALAFSLAALDWLAVAIHFKPLEYFAKPAVMVLLILWIWSEGGFKGALVWFALGITFSLAGDVFLVLPKEQLIPGLIAFLMAHLLYIAGFNNSLPPLNLASLAVALLIGFSAVKVYPRISAGLAETGHEKIQKPVLAYTVVISLMLLTALLTLVRPDVEWQPLPAILVSAGALCFYLSDTLLAWNRFVRTLAYGRLKVIVLYHLGQIGIVVGAVLHFLA
jgi:uncharacterized membrane protein YhhN